jgi:hypothetical protein
MRGTHTAVNLAA